MSASLPPGWYESEKAPSDSFLPGERSISKTRSKVISPTTAIMEDEAMAPFFTLALSEESFLKTWLSGWLENSCEGGAFSYVQMIGSMIHETFKQHHKKVQQPA